MSNQEKLTSNILTYSMQGVVLIAASLTLLLWFNTGVSVPLEKRVPGMDRSGDSVATASSRSGPEGELIISNGVPSSILLGSWSQFRGINLDNISTDEITPVPVEAGFEELWSLDVGEGFAGAVIAHGCVYLMDYDRENKKDALRCLSFDDGKEIWRYTYPVNIKRNHGMSRTIPFVSGETIVAMGPKCHVTCLNAISGEKKWSLDLVYAYGAEVPPWYAGQCPLVDDGKLILAPGGTSLMVCLDLESGEVIWETPNPKNWKMTHSSVVPMEFNGQKMYLYCASGGVVGVSADDGNILWDSEEWIIRMANVPSPLVIDENRIFFSGGYQAGSMMMQLDKTDGVITPKILYRLEDKQFGSTQHTPILFDNYIYGVRPDEQLVCLDLDGNEQWSSSSSYKFGIGPYILIGPVLYVMDDEGLLSRVRISPSKFDLIDQTQVLHGHESWAPMAFANGRIIVRDLTQMACIKIGEPKPDV